LKSCFLRKFSATPGHSFVVSDHQTCPGWPWIPDFPLLPACFKGFWFISVHPRKSAVRSWVCFGCGYAALFSSMLYLSDESKDDV
jgi:hypothetical protein